MHLDVQTYHETNNLIVVYIDNIYPPAFDLSSVNNVYVGTC